MAIIQSASSALGAGSLGPGSGNPDSPAVDPQVDAAARALDGRRIAVLTGAGVSTDSGIPDYRGAGAPVRNPMTFQEFMSDAQYRKRYWAGSHLGWSRFDSAQPNRGHLAIAALETAGHVTGVVTQNVDGLHSRAGSQRVVDLHGSMDRVRCLDCGQIFVRADIAARITRANPWLSEPDAVELAPDGDVQINAVDDFVVPECSVCAGLLKPEIVFFGEFIPTVKFDEAAAIVQRAEALVIAGSSLVVNSGIRLLDKAARRRIPIVIINRGETKGDSRATVKIDAGTSETLEALALLLSD